MKILVGTGLGLIALFVIVGITGGGKSSSSTTSAAATSGGAALSATSGGSAAASRAAPAPVQAAKPAATGIGEGTHIVGTDIQPGTYRSAGATPGVFEFCNWSTRAGAASNSKIIDFGGCER